MQRAGFSFALRVLLSTSPRILKVVMRKMTPGSHLVQKLNAG